MNLAQTHYPLLEINLDKFHNNIKQVLSRCSSAGISVAGVIKGYNGLPEMTRIFKNDGCSHIASSRLEQLEDAAKAGIEGPFMLIRIAMLSELPRLVQAADCSLQSEACVLDALEVECARQNKMHGVILMADLGDLREGFWDKDEMIRTALHVEKDLKHLHLLGVGTNLGCYGAIRPTPEKMNELADIAEQIEASIGRRLEIISGGATSSFTLVHDKTMPERINHLRIGECIILAYDLQEDWGYDMDYLYKDVFTLKAEVIEVKTKPSYPVGEIFIDAFGNTGSYEDRGIRKRALLGIGKLDICNPDKLLPRLKNIEILGGSSDHTILDIEENTDNIQVGDILEFDLCYTTMLYLTASKNVEKKFISSSAV